MNHRAKIYRRNKAFDKMHEGERYCRGCHSYSRPLSRAHLIRISLRKDLEMELNNMAYLCLSVGDIRGCHEIWDDSNLDEKKKLLCFNEFMQYIKEKDELLYNRLNK
jgi:hypothetical protein